MSTTTIEWTDRTWNPTTGCDRISPGCDNCYALTMAKRLKAMGSAKYQVDGDPRTSGPGFGLAVHRDTLNAPRGWVGPQRVFVNSMSDLFHARVPVGFIAGVWETMQATPQHTYQILTKRPDRAARVLKQVHESLGISAPLPNVWLGTSVENQKYADLRIPALLKAPAAVRFLSCEPLLGPIDLGISDLHRGHDDDDVHGAPHPRVCLTCSTDDHEVEYFRRETAKSDLDWVIAGGESGRGARPAALAWFRSLRDQCADAGVPYLFKQHGEYRGFLTPGEIGEGPHRDADLYVNIATGEAFPDAEVPDVGTWAGVWRLGKKRAGRVLDGRTWDEFPGGAL